MVSLAVSVGDTVVAGMGKDRRDESWSSDCRQRNNKALGQTRVGLDRREERSAWP